MQRGLAVAIGPPQAGMLHSQLREIRRLQANVGFAGGKMNVLRDLHVVERDGQLAFDRRVSQVRERDLNLNIGFAAVWLGESSHDIQISDLCWT